MEVKVVEVVEKEEYDDGKAGKHNITPRQGQEERIADVRQACMAWHGMAWHAMHGACLRLRLIIIIAPLRLLLPLL